MLQARFMGDYRIAIEEGPDPVSTGGDVMLDVLRCALCGSDLRPLRDGWPVTPGHEVVGRVNQPGHRLHGRRAAVYIPVWCGTCPQCRKGNQHLCENADDLMGWQRPGGYAEHMAVPEQCLLEIPDDIDTTLAPLLLDTIGTAGHAVRQARRVISPDRALVLGAGPIGLGAILVLKHMGIGEIHCVEPKSMRRTFAASLGAVVHEAAPEGTRFDLILESSGNGVARQKALELTEAEGVAVFLGESSKPWDIEENKAIRRKDFFILRSFYFPLREFGDNVALLRAGAREYRQLVDAEVDLHGLEALFDRFRQGEALKPEVTFEG